jgi:exodeoxyribonuclease-5
MIQDEFEKVFLKKLGLQPTADQSIAIKKLAKFTLDIDTKEIFLLKGFAGTGKTTLINGLVQATQYFKIKTRLLAPTGRAAKVMSRITGEPAYTIHKRIYKQKGSKDAFGTFVMADNLYTNTLFIVDEASMISNNDGGEQSIFGSGRLLDDLIKFVFIGERCKLILIGDTAQLPPVKLNVSPALDLQSLKHYLYPVYEMTLKEVVRQQKTSGILHNATLLRSKIEQKEVDIMVETIAFDDVHAISGGNLLEALNQSYDKEGIEQSIVICRSNKRANLFNQGIRKSVLYKEERITVGDLLMVVKNSYFWTEDEMDIDFIANGDIAEITYILGYKTLYGFDFADVTIRLIDYDIEINVKLLLNTLEVESAALDMESQKKLFYSVLEDYAHVKGRKAQYQAVKTDLYFNAIQVKYAYAITCHKAQGGQWQNVFIDHGYLGEQNTELEFLRWLYTAFTRPTKQLFLINFNKKWLDISEN